LLDISDADDKAVYLPSFPSAELARRLRETYSTIFTFPNKVCLTSASTDIHLFLRGD
jgi:hypothetical protein